MSPDLESPNKKRRISQACETCRKRKSKCDGGHPVCSICLSNNRICTYDHGGRKRGLQSGYVRSMETILGILVQDLPEVENKIRILLRSAEIGDKIVTPLLAETVTTIWHNSSLHEDVKVLLDHAEDGTQVAIDFLPTIITLDSSSTTISCPSSSETSPVNTNSTQSFEETPKLNILENASELIELYFLHIHYMFPIIERRDILYILHTANDYATMTSIDSSHFTCLLSMIALTLVYVKQTPETDIRIQQILKRVNLEIINVDHCIELGHIQAVLLQSLLKIHLGHYDASWLCLGQASRQIALYTEKHNVPTSRISHVIQTCNILDTFVSTICGRSSHAFFHSYPHYTVDENGLEEWEEWQGSTTSSEVHIAGTRVPVHSLSTFCNIAYIMSRLQVLSMKPLSFESCKIELEHLQSWWKTLPAHCNPPDHIKTPPSITHLQLFFHFAIMTISIKAGNSLVIVNALKGAALATLDLVERHIDMNRSDFAFLMPFLSYCINCLTLSGLAQEDLEIRDLEYRSREIHPKLRSPFASSIVGCETPIKRPELTAHQCLQRPHCAALQHSTTPAGDSDISPRISCDQPNMLQPKDSGFTDAGTDVHIEVLPLELQRQSAHPSVNCETSITNGNLIENEFDISLDTEMEAFLNANLSPVEDFEPTCHNEFVQNLGFLEGSMDAEFLALIDHDFVST